MSGISGPYSQEGELNEMRDIFRTWMKTLNKWVVRNESLRKYQVMKELGFGAQAKVYQVLGKKAC